MVARRAAGIGILLFSFALAYLVIRYQPMIEHFIRSIGPNVAVPVAGVIFAAVASAPFSVTDALAIMNGAVFGRFWGSIIDAFGIIAAAFIGYWINLHATHLLDLDRTIARLPAWIKRLKPGSFRFLLAVRIIPGLGGTLATATAAAFRVPVWIHVFTMSVVAIPVCIILSVFGEQATVWMHGAEYRARMYILHHRPHFHFRRFHFHQPR